MTTQQIRNDRKAGTLRRSFSRRLAVSALSAALVLAALWALRALWARLTGRPVTTWVMRMDPRTGFSTAFRSTQHWSSPESAQTAGNDVDAAQPEPSARRGGILPGADVDVTDVKARDIG